MDETRQTETGRRWGGGEEENFMTKLRFQFPSVMDSLGSEQNIRIQGCTRPAQVQER